MDGANRKPDNPPADPEQLTRLLELELMQKRGAWQQKKQRLGALRVLSFFFLFLVLVGAALAFWFLFSTGQMSGRKTGPAPAADSPPVSETAR